MCLGEVKQQLSDLFSSEFALGSALQSITGE